MAVVKYAGEEAVGRIAQYVNRKLTVVSAMPSSPEEGLVVLYVGPTIEEEYIQGGLYLYNGSAWIFLSATDHIIGGYYYNGVFYQDVNHAIELDAVPGYIYIDLPNNTLYLYDETLSEYLITGGGIAFGYYYEGEFYKESTHATLMARNPDVIYIDLGSNSIYLYRSIMYVKVAGSGGSYTAGYGIDINELNQICTADYVGPLATWNALSEAEKAAYDKKIITDDYVQGTEIQVAYVEELPSSGIKDVIYGLRNYTNATGVAVDGFLDSVGLFTKTTVTGGYKYTATAVEASTDGINYDIFESLEYDGTKFTLTYGDETTAIIALGDTFYYRTVNSTAYYVGSAIDQTLHLLTDVTFDNVPTQGSQNGVKSGGVYSSIASKADSATTISGYNITDAYTKTEVDNMLSELETNITWKAAVPTYNDIATTYPNPQEGWTVVTTDTNIAWRYSGGQWVKISANTIPEATTEIDGLMTSAMVTKLNGIATGAEVNQNAFSNIKVGSTTVSADGKTDTLELAGSNVTLTPDTTNDKVTIGITKANVTTALGYTPPTSDTNTHRPIQLNGTEILGNNTTALNLKAGTNVSISNSSGTVTITSTDTNTHRPIKMNDSQILGDNTTALNLKAGSNVTLTNSSGTVTIASTDTNTHRPIRMNDSEILGNNTTALNLKAGSNVSLSNQAGAVTISATDTTYSSKAAASGGTAVSLCTTGEKYNWNQTQFCVKLNISSISTPQEAFYYIINTYKTQCAGYGVNFQIVNGADWFAGCAYSDSAVDTTGRTGWGWMVQRTNSPHNERFYKCLYIYGQGTYATPVTDTVINVDVALTVNSSALPALVTQFTTPDGESRNYWTLQIVNRTMSTYWINYMWNIYPGTNSNQYAIYCVGAFDGNMAKFSGSQTISVDLVWTRRY